MPGWMGPDTLDSFHPGVHHRHHLARVGAGVGLSGLKVPELSRRAVQRRVEIEGGDVGVILMGPVCVPHRGGIVPMPAV